MNTSFCKKSWFGLLLLSFGFHFYIQAQSSTYDTGTTDTLFIDADFASLLIIPFEPHMYRSDIDRKVGEFNNMNFQEVRGYFRLGLDNALYQAAKGAYSVVRMHADNSDINKDLNHIYASIQYDYKEVEKPAPSTKTEAIKQKVEDRKQAKAPVPGTRIENGEIVSVADTRERYMSMQIENADLLQYLSEKYRGSLFLFITELDFINQYGADYRAIEQDNYQRLVRVYYSIYDKSGKQLYSGTASHLFPSQVNDLREIIAEHLVPVANQIAKKLPVLHINAK